MASRSCWSKRRVYYNSIMNSAVAFAPRKCWPSPLQRNRQGYGGNKRSPGHQITQKQFLISAVQNFFATFHLYSFHSCSIRSRLARVFNSRHPQAMSRRQVKWRNEVSMSDEPASPAEFISGSTPVWERVDRPGSDCLKEQFGIGCSI